MNAGQEIHERDRRSRLRTPSIQKSFTISESSPSVDLAAAAAEFLSLFQTLVKNRRFYLGMISTLPETMEKTLD
jgi:hypothetical protein